MAPSLDSEFLLQKVAADRKPESIIMGQVKEIVILPKNGILCIPKREMKPYLKYKYEGVSKIFNER